MNNIVLTALLVACSATLWFAAEHEITTVRGESVRLAEILKTGRSAAAAEGEDQLKSEVSKREAELAKLRATFQSEVVTIVVQPEPPSNPEAEGFWPEHRPYFYLSKKHLESIRFTAVTQRELLTDTAAKVFGMTQGEVSAVNRSFQKMKNQVRQMELATAVPTNTPPQFAKERGEKISMFVQKIPKETFEEFRKNFRGELNEALGASRGELLANRIDETFDQRSFGHDNDRVVTLIRNGNETKVAISVGTSYGINHIAHGDQPQDLPPDLAHLFPAAQK